MPDFFDRAGQWARRQGDDLGRAYGDWERAQLAAQDQVLKTMSGLPQRLAERLAVERAPRKVPAAQPPAGAAGGSRIPLRGPHPPERPTGSEARAPRTPYRYLADLTKPGELGALSTYAGPDRGQSYINPYPASNLGVEPWSDAELVDRMRAFAAGGQVDRGPQITFINDNPKNPTPNQPLNTATARMAAAAILDSGVRSVNINSTTGGHGKPGQKGSLHNRGRAVDINRINGRRVLNGDKADTTALQEAFQRQPDIAESFGPIFNLKMPGERPVRSKKIIADHLNHIHGAGPR